jgi:hypothetical protein
MLRHVFSVHYVDGLPMLGLALVLLWLRLTAVSIRRLLGYAALTITGYLRPRPDPVIEHRLRTTFTDLDRKLASILGDRTPSNTLDH